MSPVVGPVTAFQLHAVFVITGLDFSIPFPGPFHVHLPFFLALGKLGNFVFQIHGELVMSPVVGPVTAFQLLPRPEPFIPQ